MNQREIKFRAWDKEWKIMWYPDSGDEWAVTIDGKIYRNYPDECCSHHLIEYWNKAIVMQYTGLKDKNGAEIYEGDIVKGFFEGKGIKDKVIWWDKGASWYVGHDNEKTRNLTALSALDDLEVIGNIYENPELLKN